jgi:hypothetical protein
MDPTVMAAAIGIGGTVIVGVAGFSTAAWSTSKTIKAAREHRLWDQRAAVYVDTIAAMYLRQTRRKYDAQLHRDDQSRRYYEAWIAAYVAPDWHLLDARMLAFGTEPVFTALQVGSTAHEHATAALRKWRAAPGIDLAQTAALGRPPPGPTAANSSLYEAADKARKAADDLDDETVELIRKELQGEGRPLGQWQPLQSEPGSI